MGKSVATTVVRVGRAAALCAGLVVVLAVVLGIASSALAANGKPFLLGNTNAATKVSTLFNKGVGPALGLKVGAEQPPLTVNPEAGTAANLSADELDGKDSGAFMTASTYHTTSPETTGVDVGNGTGIRHAQWSCDQGDQLLTGGYRWMVNATSVAVVGSWPSGNTWLVQWANTANPNQPYEMQIYVKCADTAAPAHG